MSRRGFTLLELICVVGLTGLLLAALGTMLSLHAQHIDRTQHTGTQSGVTLAAFAQLEEDLQGLAVDLTTEMSTPESDSVAEYGAIIFRGTATGFVCSSWSRSDITEMSDANLPQVIVWNFAPSAGEHRADLLESNQSCRFKTSESGLVRLMVDSNHAAYAKCLDVDLTANEFKSVRFQYLGASGWREAWNTNDGTWPRAIQLDWQVCDPSGVPFHGSRKIVLPPPISSEGGRRVLN